MSVGDCSRLEMPLCADEAVPLMADELLMMVRMAMVII